MTRLELYDLDGNFITELYTNLLPIEGQYIIVVPNTGPQQEYYVRKVTLVFGVFNSKTLSYVKITVR